MWTLSIVIRLISYPRVRRTVKVVLTVPYNTKSKVIGGSVCYTIGYAIATDKGYDKDRSIVLNRLLTNGVFFCPYRS